MKKILITGANSYIGKSFENWLKQWSQEFSIETIDVKDPIWKEKDFTGYDVVFHVAGIAHVDTKKATKETQDLYYRVNRDLTIEIAAKAKKDGVKQFIFMSSIIVYGDSAPFGKRKIITKDTEAMPLNFYGDSKLKAENGILSMQSNEFNVAILRPPMIYGKGSKGNYPKLAKFAQILPIFPYVQNQRSMLFVDNLCEFIRLVINNNDRGIFFPQNSEYVNTSELVKLISESHGKKLILIKVFNPFIFIISKFVNQLNKVFGSLVYEMSLSEYKSNYRVKSLRDSIYSTER